MDRRQRKTRNAIFKAFLELLSEKSYNRISVGDIITRADVGRATFYAHFETKDYLLKELCTELFAHLFAAETGDDTHTHIFDCQAPDSVFLHLFQHLQRNDNNILGLLSCESNELFLRYFKEGLRRLVKEHLFLFQPYKSDRLPESFWVNHISAVFVETVTWWIDNKTKESPEVMTEYFFLAVSGNRWV